MCPVFRNTGSGGGGSSSVCIRVTGATADDAAVDDDAADDDAAADDAAADDAAAAAGSTDAMGTTRVDTESCDVSSCRRHLPANASRHATVNIVQKKTFLRVGVWLLARKNGSCQ